MPVCGYHTARQFCGMEVSFVGSTIVLYNENSFVGRERGVVVHVHSTNVVTCMISSRKSPPPGKFSKDGIGLW